MKAKVKEINESANAVLLVDAQGGEKWFQLGERVKMQYVKIGDAEVTVDQSNDTVSYLKMNSPQKSSFNPPAPKSFGQNPAKPLAPEEKKFYKTKHMVLEGLTGEQLRSALDLASENNWVIATQTHFIEGKWYAVIYYKVKE